MVKFNSLFRSKSVKTTDRNRNLESPKTQEQSASGTDANSDRPEKTDEKTPASAKSILKRIGSVYGAATAKLPGHPKPLYKRYWLWAWLGIGGTAAALSYGVWTIDRQLPSTAELNSIAREQTLTIKAVDGSILKQSGPATRDRVKLSQVPEKLRQAFIASEDKRFLQHDGVDYKGITRAFINNIRSQGVVEGGSTITQQLSRILFLNQERTVLRKLREIRLAQKMEDKLSKDEILERYLNLVYLGGGAYGVADAAWVYFSKELDELTLAETATIAGLAPAPSRFAPDRNPDAAKSRRNLVLQRMFDDGFISASQKQAAENEDLVVQSSPPKRTQTIAPYFTSYVQKELPKLVPEDAIAAGGLTVETTINPKFQKYAEEAVERTIRNRGRYQRFKQAALVSLNPRTGEIKAMVGGRDFGKNQFNRVTQAQRQPGSTFKAFVYAAAIASGRSPYQSYRDTPYIIDGYEPKNFDEGYRGTMTIRNALTKSVNIIAVKVLVRTGFNPIINLANDMGIKSPLKPTYSLALGSNEVNLLELTNAYGSLANEGLYTPAHGITRIHNRQGEVLWQAKHLPSRALDSESAAIMTWMLRNVVTSGTGSPASLGRRPVAGKTGTTDQSRDLWFVGYIPQMVTGVWLGNDNNKPTYGTSASAAYAWRQFMRKAVEGMEIESFPKIPKKLTGRKPTIKAEPIKPKRVINRPIPSQNRVGSDDDAEAPRRRRRRRSRGFSSNNDSSSNSRRSRRRTSSRRRNRSRTSSTTNRTNTTGTRRSRRRIRRRSQSSSNSSPSRTRRRRRPARSSSPSRSSQPRRRSSPPASNSSGGSSGSWRERLRPSGE